MGNGNEIGAKLRILKIFWSRLPSFLFTYTVLLITHSVPSRPLPSSLQTALILPSEPEPLILHLTMLVRSRSISPGCAILVIANRLKASPRRKRLEGVLTRQQQIISKLTIARNLATQTTHLRRIWYTKAVSCRYPNRRRGKDLPGNKPLQPISQLHQTYILPLEIPYRKELQSTRRVGGRLGLQQIK